MNISRISRTTTSLPMPSLSIDNVCADNDPVQKSHLYNNPANTIGISTKTCTLTHEAQIASLMNHLNDALKTINPTKVTVNHASVTTLLPTISNTPRANPDAIKAYFLYVLDRKSKDMDQ